MSLIPIGFGDVVGAIKICIEIREKWFNPINSAPVKYLEFKQDIVHLEKRLGEFRNAFSQALVHVDDLPGLDPIHVTLKQEADELIGDFTSTLKDCHNLLADHVRFDTTRGTFIDNVYWHSSTEAKVNGLRGRIQLHDFKIRLFLEPVQLRLANHILGNTYEILELLRTHFGLDRHIELPGIPTILDLRFRDALKRDSPIPIRDPTQIPLEEGVNALILHHRQSLIGTETSRSVEQYLNLLKAHWLVQIVSRSEGLKQTRLGHLYRRIIKQVEQRIAKQYARTDISHYSEDALGALEQSAFAIWPEKIRVPKQRLTEPRDQEEKLGELTLVHQSPSEKRSLLIFRVDERYLRIVESCTPDDPISGPEELKERFVDLGNDGLVPLYTISAHHRTDWNIEILYGNGAARVAYPLKERSDAFKLQHAFTGYHMTFYSEEVSCTVTACKTFSIRNPQHEGLGEIQLWQWPQRGRVTDSPNSPTTSIRHSGISDSNHSTVSNAFHRINPSVLSVSRDENGNKVVLSTLPCPPLLMAFTKDDESYRIWKTDITSLKITESNNGEYRTVLRHLRGETFQVHELFVTKSELDYWNICGLFPSFQLKSRDPRRFTVKTLKCKNLVFDFLNTHKRDEFEIGLLKVMRARLEQLRNFKLGQIEAENQMEAKKASQSPSQLSSAESCSLRTMSHQSSSPTTVYRTSSAPTIPINIPNVHDFSTEGAPFGKFTTW